MAQFLKELVEGEIVEHRRKQTNLHEMTLARDGEWPAGASERELLEI